MAEKIPTVDTKIILDSRDQAKKNVQALIQSARQEIIFFGPMLDDIMFNNDDCIQQLTQFLTQSQRTRARFLVHDTRKNSARGHRLISLSQRLSSKIHIHQTGLNDKQQHHLFLLIDTKAYLYCPNNERYEGIVDFDAAATVREKQKQFEEMWAQSIPDVNVRRLQL
ncbi:MAG TPA: hypothetical protein ENI26_05195 [Methylophaga aminisulfidivorans]|uniref:DUF7931 domain-containing protein n=1 Tax=Methylophaga aminisulfidivorans TaxID=230105 RepID=A0A7C2AAR0_9GAMM|nr:hypothetical protein [Methylophaga aminisulfidivorans]